jgi:8-oxo-dGTP pyrophosphatase MutT (NUDIX family)
MVRPRYASTVVLVRPDKDHGFEILLTRRPAGMKFMGGFFVFPGGTVHEEDYSPRAIERCRGLSGGQARRLLGNRHDTQVALGHWVAGFRELFEEVGILLCESESGRLIDGGDDATKRRIEEKRKAIVRQELNFGDFLASENLYCDLSRITYFFHRVTPEIYSMRFDTRFYLASLPANQRPLERSEEVTDSVWINASGALARGSRGDFPILPPTTTVLDDLAQIGSWNELRARFQLR